MKPERRKQKAPLDTKKQAALVFTALAVLVVVVASVFLKFYSAYNDQVLYAERLNQMQEVTEQLFSGLEDVVRVQWENAKFQCNVLKDAAPATVDEMTTLMKKQAVLADLENKQSDLIAIDSEGRYYYQSGPQGMMVDMSYLNGMPAQVSYVFNEMTSDRAQMLFLYRLDEPLVLQSNGKTKTILYYGLAEDMEQLNPYFDCKAYNGNNSTYVVDNQGLKLFSGSSSSSKDLLEGFNIFTVLRI